MVHCRLDPPSYGESETQRYVPLSEFQLWKHLMETKHRRMVTILAASVWVSEDPMEWNSGFMPGDLEPVVRVCFETGGALGLPVRIERFLPAAEYPKAQEALLMHFPEMNERTDLRATPGYFVPRNYYRSL